MSPRSARERDRYRDRIHRYERTPAWKRRANRYRKKHGLDCQACGGRCNPSYPLHVHHRSYAHAFHGREPDRDLRGLCPGCHSRVHYLARRSMTLADATDRVIWEGRRQRGLTSGGVWRALWRLLAGK